MLSSPEDARSLGVPSVGVVRAPGIRDRSLHRRPQLAEERIVTAQLPVPVQFEHVPELSVGAGTLRRPARSERKRHAKTHAPCLVQVIGVVGLAHAPLEVRKQERQSLLIIPDMGATALAAPDILVQAFPSVEGAIRKARHRGRLEDAQVGRCRVENWKRQARSIQGIAEQNGFRSQPVPIAKDLPSDLDDPRPLRCVPVLPGGDVRGRILEVPDGRHPVLGKVRNVPADQESNGLRLARGDRHVSGLEAVIPVTAHSPGCVARVTSPVLETAGPGQVVPIDLKRVEPETVIKVGLRAGLSRVRGDQQLGIGFGLRVVGVARDLHAMHVAVPDLLGLRGPERPVSQHGRDRVVENFPGRVTQFDLEQAPRGCSSRGC